MKKTYVINVLNLIEKILKFIVRIESIIATYFFMIVVFAYSFDIIRRMIVNRSVVWIPHAGLMMYVWVIFIGIGPLFYKREQIQVEYFVQLLPAKMKIIIQLLGNFLVLSFFIIILWHIPKLISLQLNIDIVLPVPRYFYTLPLIIGSITIILVEIKNILKIISTQFL